MRKPSILLFLLALAIVPTACGSRATPSPVFITPTANGVSAAPTETPVVDAMQAPSTPRQQPADTPIPELSVQAAIQPTTTSMIAPTAAPAPQSTETPSPAPSPLPPANALGQVMVLQYHLIESPDDQYRRAPDSFRADLQRLYDLGYYPANLIDLALRFPDLPPGKKPVIFTFDDSDITQFNYLADGSIDPDSAVGAMLNFHRQRPEEWPLRGTFFVLQEVDAPQRILFGQPEYAAQKLAWLVERGFEVGSHTISHFDLAAGTDEQIQWQLAVSQRQLETLLPGYDVRSLSAPFGNFPENRGLLQQGMWEGEVYTYTGAVMAWGGPSPSPFSPEFEPYSIPRIPVTGAELDYWLNYFEQNPALYYVSE